MTDIGPVTIITADGVTRGHLTHDDILVVDEVIPTSDIRSEDNDAGDPTEPEFCQVQTYRQTLETPAEYCEEEMPCPIHGDGDEEEYDG